MIEGILTIKSEAVTNLQIQELVLEEPEALEVIVKADIPGEPQVTSDKILIQGKNVESNENLVMKFASGYNNKIHDFQGNNPFKAVANRNQSGTLNNINDVIVIESVLTLADQASSPYVDNIDNTHYVGDGQGDGKTYVRTSTVVNGVNEKGTEILDFEYSFPVDSTTGNNTSRQYAPMSEANAGWDSNRPAREEAAYGCLDSGQGCGGTSTLALSGNWTETTEGSSFYGYEVGMEFKHEFKIGWSQWKFLIKRRKQWYKCRNWSWNKHIACLGYQ